MIVSVLLVLYVITLVSLARQKLLGFDELSILGFLNNQENRGGICCFKLYLSNLYSLLNESSQPKKLCIKKPLKHLITTSQCFLLHLYIFLKNQVKSLVFELRCNSSCQLRSRDIVCSLNTHCFVYKRDSSQKLPSVLFRARELVLSINFYLYRAKRKRKRCVQQCVYVHSRLLFNSSLNS